MAAAPAGPAGQRAWSLPHEQRILRQGETAFDLDRVAQELTVVMSTSVGTFTPSSEKVLTALESLQANVALRWCRKILVFDKVPSQEEIEHMKKDARAWRDVARGPKWEAMWNEKRDSYDEYCETLQEMKTANHPALFNVELVLLPVFGHLFGTVKRALEQVATEYVFFTQHDLRLAPRFVAADVQRVLEALSGGAARYILLNRDVNSGSRTRVYFQMRPDMDAKDDARGLSLTAVSGFSDQAHFAEAQWYRQAVIDAIPLERRLTCMEHVLHEPWKADPDWKGTFLYGGTDDGPFVYDLVHGVQVYDQHGKLMGLAPMPDRSVPT